jgi:hypothetical protein
VGYHFMMYRQQLVGRDGLNPFVFTCDKPPLSHVNIKYVLNAGYYHLVNWVRYGLEPPIALPIEIASGQIPRDENGHAFGGIRLASLDVPTATNTGKNTGASFCTLYGTHEPFSEHKLSTLYPTHNAYVRAVREVTMRNVREGFVLADDAQEIIREAIQSRVGTPNPLPIP